MTWRVMNAKSRDDLADYLIRAGEMAYDKAQLRILYKCAVIAIGKDDPRFSVIEGAFTDFAAQLDERVANWVAKKGGSSEDSELTKS